jgi:hypothetical protein
MCKLILLEFPCGHVDLSAEPRLWYCQEARQQNANEPRGNWKPCGDKPKRELRQNVYPDSCPPCRERRKRRRDKEMVQKRMKKNGRGEKRRRDSEEDEEETLRVQKI